MEERWYHKRHWARIVCALAAVAACAGLWAIGWHPVWPDSSIDGKAVASTTRVREGYAPITQVGYMAHFYMPHEQFFQKFDKAGGKLAYIDYSSSSDLFDFSDDRMWVTYMASADGMLYATSMPIEFSEPSQPRYYYTHPAICADGIIMAETRLGWGQNIFWFLLNPVLVLAACGIGYLVWSEKIWPWSLSIRRHDAVAA